MGTEGSGKTTLLHMLIRAYDPRAGEVSLDGVSLVTLQLRSLRECIGIVR